MSYKKLCLHCFVCFMSIFVLSADSCFGPSLPPTTAGGGFFIETEFLSNTGSIFPVPVPGVTTSWSWKNDVSGFTALGDASPFQNTTNLAAIGVSENGRAPALWDVSWLNGGPPQCIGAPETPLGSFQSNPQRVTEVICFQETVGTAQLQVGQEFLFNPTVIYTDGSSGSTATITGQGFSGTYGMPLLQYFDLAGNLISQTNVTSVASDGTWVTVTMPDVSQLQLGEYVGFIYNANASGSYDYIGTAAVSILDPPPPPPPPDNGCGSTGGGSSSGALVECTAN